MSFCDMHVAAEQALAAKLPDFNSKDGLPLAL